MSDPLAVVEGWGKIPELRDAIRRLEDVGCSLKFGNGFACTEGPDAPRAVPCGRCNALTVLRKVLAREETR